MCTRFALFGSSYIARLGNFCDHSLRLNGRCRFFGLGGMRSERIPGQLLQDLIDFRPDIVFIHLGGNDISKTSEAKEIFDRLVALTDQLTLSGVQHVFISEIITRGKFNKSPGLTRLNFDVQRLQINRMLMRKFGDHYVRLSDDVRYPADYNNDGVHIGVPRGMRKYQNKIELVLNRCSS